VSFKLWGRHSSVRTLKVIQALAELGIRPAFASVADPSYHTEG
jgi:hypothetical protein